MKLAIGTGLAAAAVICLGLSVSAPQAEAATTTCTVTTVKNFKGACPPGMKFAGGSAGSVLPEPAATPTVTPTSGPGGGGCVKTNVKNLKNSCNAAS